MDALRFLARLSTCLLLPAGNLFLGVLLGRQLVRSGWPEQIVPLGALIGAVLGLFLSWREIRTILQEKKK